MSKRVLIYARYSTDRQNEVSIETQIDVCREFAVKKEWQIVEVYSDAAVSGTSFRSRPGIQALRNKVKSDRIDIVLCVTVDRLSRDVEHSSKLLKEFRFLDVDIWTVHGGNAVTDMELAIRAVLSHEMIEQIRYRTREGMKTAVRKGSASTCLAYGYKLGLRYDAKGDRIPGLREIDDDKAPIIIRIFEEYASGVSPRDIAKRLNAEGILGPRGRKWRDTAIRGHVSRGTGILNNEIYLGRMIWNRQQFRKNPETEKRTARANDEDQWVIAEVAEMRIVSDELWARVKRKQIEVGELFSHTDNNRLNAAHRPSYLLSGLLECAECGGPYTTSGKARYSCKNHKDHLPIDELGGACCSNSKTILRENVEDRVINCLPGAFFSMGIFEKVGAQVRAKHEAQYRSQPSLSVQLSEELDAILAEQKGIIQQISDRAKAGRPALAALDDMLDSLEAKRQEAVAKLAAASDPEADNLSAKLAKLYEETKPESVELIVNTWLHYIRNHANRDVKQPFVDIVRMLIQKVVVGPRPGHQQATLQVHGRIASILAAMEASTILEKQLITLHRHQYLEAEDAGLLDTEDKRKKLLNDFAEELDVRRQQWRNLQVSVVAGACNYRYRHSLQVTV